MTTGIYKLRMRDGTARWAHGTVEDGPQALLDASVSLDRVLAERRPLSSLRPDAVVAPLPAARVVAPIDAQEVWAAGVTYGRSREARREEAADPTPYDLVYQAERPELFWKAPGWRCVGTGEAIGIRTDSSWDVPEPEVTLVLDAELAVAGCTIGNDVSSRSIEGVNPLYLPQAKTYERSCALGPCIVPADELPRRFRIRMLVERDGVAVVDAVTTTAQMRRSFEELVGWLGVAQAFPVGAFLMTGTGIVPGSSFTLGEGDVVRIDVAGLGTLVNNVVRVGTPSGRRR